MVIPTFVKQALFWTTYYSLWRRQTEPLFWLCRRRRRRATQAYGPPGGGWPGFQHRFESRDHDSRSRPAVKELTNSKSEIVFVPYDEAYEEGFEDMPRRVPDISKISDLVGFEPRMELDGILQSVIEFHSHSQAVGG